MVDEIMANRAPQCDFHFEGKDAREMLRNLNVEQMGMLRQKKPIITRRIPGSNFRIAERKLMKKSYLKELIRNIIKEAFDKQTSLDYATPQQKDVVKLLVARGFTLSNMEDGNVVKLTRPYGKGKHGGPRYALVFPDGKINQEKVDVRRYLNIVGEEMTKQQKPEFKRGVTIPFAAVNVGEAYSKSNKVDFDAKGISKQKPNVGGIGVNSLRTYRGVGLKAGRAKTDGHEDVVNSALSWFKKAVALEKTPEYIKQAGDAFKEGFEEGKKNVNQPIQQPVKSQGVNSIELYRDAGQKAGQAAKNKDYRLVGHHQGWFNKAIKLEKAPYSQEARQAFTDAYKEASGYNDKPKYFNEDLGVGAGIAIGVASTFIYRGLKNLIKHFSNTQWNKSPLTEQKIEYLFKALKIYQPSMRDDDINYIKNAIMGAFKRGDIKTFADMSSFADDLINKEKKKGDEIPNVNEESSTGACAGYSTPFAFSRKGSKGSSRAIKAAKKYGTVVKSISEETK